MTAYEFTRPGVDFTNYANPQYDVGIVEWCIEHNNPGRDFTQEPAYKEADNIFFEITSSCTKTEAMNWLKFYMVSAIGYGVKTKNSDWMHKFLAARDLYEEIRG